VALVLINVPNLVCVGVLNIYLSDKAAIILRLR